MSLGNVIGGGVDGYFAQQQNSRAQAAEDRLKSEQMRIDAQRALDDDLNKATAEFIKTQQSQATNQQAPQGVQAVVANGIPGAQTGGSSAAQVNPVAAGIDAKPKTFDPTHEHMIELAKFRADWRLGKGDFNGALEEHKNAMAFAADKLQKETALRNRAVDSAIGGIARGDYSGVSQVYDMIPDGHKLAGINKNKDGTITMKVIGKDGKPLPDVTFKSDEHLAHAVKAVSDPASILKHWDDEFKRQIDLIKANADKTKAEAEASKSKNGNPSDKMAKIKAARDELALAYGVKLDAMGQVLNRDAIKDMPGYFSALKDAEARINNGEEPYATADDLQNKGRRKAELKKAGVNPAAGGLPEAQAASGTDHSKLWK